MLKKGGGSTREELVFLVKSLALNRGFKVKLPYADRIDKNQIRTVNFYCQKFRSLFGKTSLPHVPCQFRLTYKTKSAPKD